MIKILMVVSVVFAWLASYGLLIAMFGEVAAKRYPLFSLVVVVVIAVFMFVLANIGGKGDKHERSSETKND